jgi:tRNA acetyltransferase TAN1
MESTLLRDFNLLVSTSRGNERQMCSELEYLLEELIGDPEPAVTKTGIRGLVVAKTTLNPCEVIGKLRGILQERPYEFRYALRIIPIERVLPTNLEEIKKVATELSTKIGERETFRVTVEKRFTDLHAKDIITTVAEGIEKKVDLEHPNRILLIEVLGGLTGISLIRPVDLLAVLKEKML